MTNKNNSLANQRNGYNDDRDDKFEIVNLKKTDIYNN